MTEPADHAIHVRSAAAAGPGRAVIAARAAVGVLGIVVGFAVAAAIDGSDGPPSASASEPATSRGAMPSILVHITHGPEHPTRAALGFAVAEAAVRQGHTVSVFLAGDGVQLVRDGVLDNLNGLGTGNLRQLWDGVVAGGARVYLSGGSSRARGIGEADVSGKDVEMAGPDRLVELSLEHDRMFTY